VADAGLKVVVFSIGCRPLVRVARKGLTAAVASGEWLVVRADLGNFKPPTGSGQAPGTQETQLTKTGQSGKRKDDELVGEQTIGNVSTGLARR
jgi:hypothetical protein